MASDTASNWRSELSVLAPDAQALGTIAVIRSLGRAGYRVHACSSDRDALGLKSRFAHRSTIAPFYSDSNFVDWLRDYLAKNKINAIVPSEGFLHAIRDYFEEFSSMMAIPQDPRVVYRAFSQIQTAEHLSTAPESVDIATHLPPSLVIRSEEALPSLETIESLGTPIYLKSDAEYCKGASLPLLVRAATSEDALLQLRNALETHSAVLMQGYVGGIKAAASFASHKSKLLAESGVVGIHTNPHTGGMMSLRESRRLPLLQQAAFKWFTFMDWSGVAMMECKWEEQTGQFWFIEMNARYWGYLHLDLASGVDVPRIQMDAYFDRGDETHPSQKEGILLRHTIPGDLGWLASLVKDPAIPWRSKLRPCAKFATDCFNPTIGSDLYFQGDRALYFRELKRALTSSFSRFHRTGGPRRTS